MQQKGITPVNDYWKFTRDLRSQLKLIRVFESQFFELDDLCEWSVRNGVTVMKPDTGERVSVVDADLAARQADVYDRLCTEVGNLYDMLCQGRACFEVPDAAGSDKES